ncbi:glycogen/starch/alpha-glucan phosphorylase, partial [Pseudomonas aeruginosa]|nr:glycogen/starch/alpha-glucan phosphorylase [Pseudomonas aeruginosa]
FGKDSDTIINLYATASYVAKDYYDNHPAIKAAVNFIISPELLAFGNEERLDRLYKELISKDWFMTLIDLEEYIEVKEKMLADYEDQDLWMTKVVHNIAKAGFFSSDRTIEQYNEDIWHSR